MKHGSLTNTRDSALTISHIQMGFNFQLFSFPEFPNSINMNVFGGVILQEEKKNEEKY